MEKTGAAPMLKSVVGEWFVPVTTAKASATAQQPVSAPVTANQPIRNVDPTGAIAGQNVTADMINQYEERSGLKDKEGPKVVNDDASIVGQVRKTAQVGQKNHAGVHIEDSEIGKKTTVYREQQTVKQTSHNPTLDASEPAKRQKPVIVSDSEGVVIQSKRSAKIKSKNANEVNMNTRVNDEQGVIMADETVAKETNYDEEGQPVDVTGSSTQAQAVKKTTNTPKAGSGSKKAADEKAKRIEMIKKTLGDQDGVIVGKVRKDEGDKSSSEGFVAKLTVGAQQEAIMGEEATVSNGGVDIEGLDSDFPDVITDLSNDEAIIIDSDDNSDIDSIIEQM